MQYQSVIFDLDGTLLDTLDDLAASVNAALAACAYPLRSRTEIRSFVGNGVAKLIERSVPDGVGQAETQQCLAIFRSHYMEHMYDTTRPYDGILPLLSKLTARGFRLAIVSNKLDPAVKELSRRFFSDRISVALGAPADAKKPDPKCVFDAAAELNVPLDACIYAGDSDVDIMTAHNAGLPCIGVAWGFRGRAHLEQQKADYIVDSPEELEILLEQLQEEV